MFGIRAVHDHTHVAETRHLPELFNLSSPPAASQNDTVLVVHVLWHTLVQTTKEILMLRAPSLEPCKLSIRRLNWLGLTFVLQVRSRPMHMRILLDVTFFEWGRAVFRHFSKQAVPPNLIRRHDHTAGTLWVLVTMFGP